MNEIEFVEPMFPVLANDRDRDIIVGQRPLRMIRSLEKIFELSMQNSLITYLSGDQGSGKSHVLNYMKYIFEERKSHQMVILNANDWKKIDESMILIRVHQNSELNKKFAEIRGQMSPDNVVDEALMIKEINRRTLKINEHSGGAKTHGLIIAIDGLDEYMRENKSDAAQLLIVVRLLLDELDKTCILLTLTHDVFNELHEIIIKDRTFIRRFIGPLEYDGSTLKFEGFNIEETFDLYKKYKENWLNRNSAKYGIDQEHYHKLIKSEWPISRDAISLAWDATGAHTPGSLQLLFQSAFEELRDKHPGDGWKNPCNIITSELMASIISTANKRGESGLHIGSEFLENKIKILKNLDSYINGVPKDSVGFDEAFMYVARDLIEQKGFTVSLFNWNEVPGNDNERLIEFLKQKFELDWIKTAKINKINDDSTIKVSTEKNNISLKLNDEKTKVSLEIDDERTDEFIAKKENDKLRIYLTVVDMKPKEVYEGYYLMKLSKQRGKEINRCAIGFLIKKDIELEDIEFLEKNISRKQDGDEVKYNIVITGDSCKYIYDPWKKRPINIIKHLKKAEKLGLPENIIGISKYHLGNYTFTIPLDSEKKQWISATYNQHKEKYYKALLEQADKKCGIKMEIRLSDIFESICNAALY